MATAPHTPPPVKHSEPAHQAPATKDAAPPPVETIAEEQRRRSAEMEAMGVEAWMKAQHEPDPAPKKP